MQFTVKAFTVFCSVHHRALHHNVRVPGSADLHRTRRLMRLTIHAWIIVPMQVVMPT